jgi:hypothetical protein
MSVERLTHIVEPPERPARTVDWPTLETELGLRLPHDYRDLVETYGPGSFDEFIHIYQPNSPLREVDLAHQRERAIWALKKLQEGGEEIPYSLTDPVQLLPFGRTDNGDVCYWFMHDADDPNAWTVVVNAARDSRWVEYLGTVTSFLADVLSGTFEVAVFPDDFPSEEPFFEPYDIDA